MRYRKQADLAAQELMQKIQAHDRKLKPPKGSPEYVEKLKKAILEMQEELKMLKQEVKIDEKTTDDNQRPSGEANPQAELPGPAPAPAGNSDGA